MNWSVYFVEYDDVHGIHHRSKKALVEWATKVMESGEVIRLLHGQRVPAAVPGCYYILARAYRQNRKEQK